MAKGAEASCSGFELRHILGCGSSLGLIELAVDDTLQYTHGCNDTKHIGLLVPDERGFCFGYNRLLELSSNR